MADSLKIAESIETLGGGSGIPSDLPMCDGATFTLNPGFDLGAPQPTTDEVATLVLDGERPFGTRASNRTLELPISITAGDRLTLAGAIETLLQLMENQTFTITWTRDPEGGTALPLVFDCFRAEPSKPVYDLIDAQQYSAGIVVTCQALPYGRSDTAKQLVFDAPATGTTAPPSPKTLADFSTVSGEPQWVQSSDQFIVGPHSAKWDPSIAPASNTFGTGLPAVWGPENVIGGPVDLTGLTNFSFWAGFGSNYFYFFRTGPVSFTITLYDNLSRTISFGGTQACTTSQNKDQPSWSYVTFAIPQGNSNFDYTHVSQYKIKMTNSSGGFFGGGFSGSGLTFVDAYLDNVVANAVTGGAVASTRGKVYDLFGIIGTSHAELAMQFEQAPISSAQTVTYSTPGAIQFIVEAGVTQISVTTVGGGGAGAGRTSSGQAAGGSGGGWSQTTTYSVTEGQIINGFVGAGGTDGASPVNGQDTWFDGTSSSNAGVMAKGGLSLAQNATTGAAAPALGTGTTRFTGSAGQNSGANPGAGGAAGGSGGNGTGASGGAAGTAGNRAGNNGSAPGGGGSGATSTSGTQNGGAGAAGQIVVSWTRVRAPFSTVVAHRPGADSPSSLTPFVNLNNGADTPDGSIHYLVPSKVAGVNAVFGGTYSIMLVANTFANIGTSRTVTVTFTQYEYQGGPSYTDTVTRTFVPSTDITNGMISLGVITLPIRDIAPDNTSAYFDVTVTSGQTGDRYLDVLFLDTQGQTCWVNTTSTYVQFWIDQPDSDRDLGRVLGSAFGRAEAISVLGQAIVSGGPLTVDPGDNTLLCYCKEGAPSLVAYYFPHWFLERLA